MLKLLIADDERVIRETLADIIDWKSCGIEIIGLCQNGIEAWEMIQDEAPDIVLTDIKMPGLTGLELIEYAHRARLPVQFIILSGFGEFEYAKQAMKYGVQYYLLKPCNEKQIIECIQECIENRSNIYLSRSLRKSELLSLNNMLHSVLSSIINDELSSNTDFDRLAENYEQYLDFYFTPYRLTYIYYLEEEKLEKYLAIVRELHEKHMPQSMLYGCYVHWTLILFFPADSPGRQAFEDALKKLSGTDEFSRTESNSSVRSSLKDLLTEITKRMNRFSNIYYINNYRPMYICNYHSIMRQIEGIYRQIREKDSADVSSLTEITDRIDSPDFLKQLSGNLLLKFASDTPSLSSAELTQWLFEIQKEQEPEKLKEIVAQKLQLLIDCRKDNVPHSSMTQQIFDYVEEHMGDPDLTLKYIAETRLYMNVDYASRKFYKETGEKFSHYLTKARIKKAKDLMRTQPDISIQETAARVGFGNNPRYFSQIFKKEEGITPSDFLLTCR